VSGWFAVGDEDAAGLERELARELPDGHVLKGVSVRAIARRFDQDDVVFRLEDGRLCVVHLTWNVEREPAWPSTSFVAKLPVDDVDEET
jgi:hypothetical protein